MKFFRLTRRHNEVERCVCLWTPWVTMIWDFGSIQCRGTDEFELVIKHKVWGPIFYWGNRDLEKLGERAKFDKLQFSRVQARYREQRKKRIDDRDFFEQKEQAVREGKRKNPADMNYAERHATTMEAVKKMKFSANFVHLMTTPSAKLALERGDTVPGTGDDAGTILTEEVYEKHKAQARQIPVRNVGLLGFKKGANGYEPITVPNAAKLQQMPTDPIEEHKMLGEGQ